MALFSNIILAEVISTIFYTALGLILMAGCWRVIEWLTPFSLEEEIRQQNLAIAVLIGSIFIALAIVISGVIRS